MAVRLPQIVAQRAKDVEGIVGGEAALEARWKERYPDPPLNLAQCLQPHGDDDGAMRILAEFKRASPSKGDIASAFRLFLVSL